MKIIKALILLAFVVAFYSLTGCGGKKEANPLVTTPSPTASEVAKIAAEKKNIALVMKTLTNPFFIEMEKGARKAANEMDVILTVKTGAQETSIDQQIAIIEELIRMKIDAIVIAPASSIELIPVLKKAQDEKIAIVNIDNRLDSEVAKKMGLVNVPFISVDNEKGSYLSAKFLSGKFDGSTEVLILEGIRSAKNAQERTSGALKAFKENANANVAAVATANWKIDEAYAVAQSQFRTKPSIGAVFCGNDMMALGVVKYLKESGRTGVLVAGFDALDEAKRAVEDGTLLVTVDQRADMQGYLGVKMALQKLRGEPVSPETLIEVKLISKGVR
ncbi:MAG TPA: substrate-binding domain-containing protein [Negativicutes bacterium]|nr:substrate-binding domain-containing protein [Negativicutes bacterium]